MEAEAWPPAAAGDAGRIRRCRCRDASRNIRRFPKSRRAPSNDTSAALPDTAAHPDGTADLSEDEVTSLAEQLAEARHEEVAAEAEADAQLGMLDEELPQRPEAAAETEEFVAEAKPTSSRGAGRSIDEPTHDEPTRSIEQAPRIAAEAMARSGARTSRRRRRRPQRSACQPESQPMSARISEPQRARFQRPMRRGGRPQRGRRNVRRASDHRHSRRAGRNSSPKC